MMNALDAFHLALDLAKQAGFTLANAASNSETCYYTHPHRAPLLLRISMHKNKYAPIGMVPPVARATFSPRDKYLNEQRVKDMMRWAIGSYFINDVKPSRYSGPKKWRTLTNGVAIREFNGEAHQAS